MLIILYLYVILDNCKLWYICQIKTCSKKKIIIILIVLLSKIIFSTIKFFKNLKRIYVNNIRFICYIR